jgi:hypothetical protein
MTTKTYLKWLLKVCPVEGNEQPDWANPISKHSFWSENDAYEFAKQHNAKNFYGPVIREGRSIAFVYGTDLVEADFGT